MLAASCLAEKKWTRINAGQAFHRQLTQSFSVFFSRNFQKQISLTTSVFYFCNIFTLLLKCKWCEFSPLPLPWERIRMRIRKKKNLCSRLESDRERCVRACHLSKKMLVPWLHERWRSSGKPKSSANEQKSSRGQPKLPLVPPQVLPKQK